MNLSHKFSRFFIIHNLNFKNDIFQRELIMETFFIISFLNEQTLHRNMNYYVIHPYITIHPREYALDARQIVSLSI